MTFLAVVFIMCLVAYYTGVWVGQGEFHGWPAIISFFGMCSSGLVLAVHAL